MADYDRRRDEQERYRYRNEDRDRWQNEGGFGEYGREARSRDYGGTHMGEYGRERHWRGYEEGGYRPEGLSRSYGSSGDYRGASGYGRSSEGSRGRFGGEYGEGGFGESSGYGRGYGSSGYGSSGYGRGYGGAYGGYGHEGYGRGEHSGSGEYGRGKERGFWDRASDEVSSWFGDEQAERRRHMDEMQGAHRGRGPKGYARSDDRIREDVCDRLSDDPWVDASEIDVTVSNREVTLSGTVDSREAKRRAEDCVERVSGVTNVNNNLRVQSQSMVSGTQSTGMGKATTAGQTADTDTGTNFRRSG